MFSKRLPLGALVEFCRALRHMVDSGLTLAMAMKQQGKSGPLVVRPVAARMAKRLASGDAFAEVLYDEQDRFPPLFLALSGVAEDTGKLPEALRELEEFFRLQQKLRRQFFAEITWPVTQFVLAILVIAGLIWILGIIGGANSPITVFGLKGGTGAMIFLSYVGLFLAGLVAVYWILRHVLNQGPAVDRFLLNIPGIGGCLQALAIARFSMAMALTVDAGTKIGDAVRLSLRATGNSAFACRDESAAKIVNEGLTLTEALREQHLFPDEYLAIVETAEISAQEPEVFAKQAEHYHEIATYRMKFITSAAAKLVYAMVAIFIIVMIFHLYSQMLAPVNAMLG
jgi:type IV pilus assembly protein PilC